MVFLHTDLKNAKLNSIHARFKGCMKNIRATPIKLVAMNLEPLNYMSHLEEMDYQPKHHR